MHIEKPAVCHSPMAGGTCFPSKRNTYHIILKQYYGILEFAGLLPQQLKLWYNTSKKESPLPKSMT